MAGMKRFVTYIYAYEDKKKGNNVGFAKIEVRGEECRIEIHLRGVYAAHSECQVYLFLENSGSMEGVPIGKLKLANGNGDFGMRIKTSTVGESEYSIHQMEGLILLTEDEQIFMSRWTEGNPIEVCKENFREWMPVEPTPETSIEEAEESILHATEVPMQNLFPDTNWDDIWENMKVEHTVYRPFEDREVECVQIELKHLRELPKKYWYLGNNSFLLHGFFNYRYVIVGRTGEGRGFIGVPGIYQRQERVMAAIFGFPEFIAMVQDAEQEENGAPTGEPTNRFGCWARFFDE